MQELDLKQSTGGSHVNADEGWNRLDKVTNMAMHRWTAARPGYKTFKLERHGEGERAVYQIIIEATGREPRCASS